MHTLPTHNRWFHRRDAPWIGTRLCQILTWNALYLIENILYFHVQYIFCSSDSWHSFQTLPKLSKSDIFFLLENMVPHFVLYWPNYTFNWNETNTELKFMKFINFWVMKYLNLELFSFSKGVRNLRNFRKFLETKTNRHQLVRAGSKK
jgi:hypothetical protein